MFTFSPATHKWLRSYGLVILAIFMWSFSEILQKLLQGTVPPMSKSFFRFFIGIIPLAIIMLFQKDWKMKDLWQRNHRDLLIAGIIGFGLGNFVYFLGIIQTKANIGSVIYGTYPIFISIYSIFILNERKYLRRRFIGYIIGFVGIAVLILGEDLSSLITPDNMLGNILVLCGAMIWSIFSVLGKKITSKERMTTTNVDLKFNFITMTLAGLTNLFFIFWIPEERNTFFVYPAISWVYILILGIFTTGIGTWIFFVGIQNMEVSKGISLANLKPIFVLILAFVILEEMPSLILFVSIPIILGGVYLVTTPPKQIKINLQNSEKENEKKVL
jgi:drug/metabolite transporter (DMT)-like permease